MPGKAFVDNWKRVRVSLTAARSGVDRGAVFPADVSKFRGGFGIRCWSGPVRALGADITRAVFICCFRSRGCALVMYYGGCRCGVVAVDIRTVDFVYRRGGDGRIVWFGGSGGDLGDAIPSGWCCWRAAWLTLAILYRHAGRSVSGGVAGGRRGGQILVTPEGASFWINSQKTDLGRVRVTVVRQNLHNFARS